MKKILRVLALAFVVGWPLKVHFDLAIESHREIRRLNSAVFAIMDLQVRTFHYAVGHPTPVQGCRECYKDVHDYLNALEKDHPEAFGE